MYSNSSHCNPGIHFLGLKAFFDQVGKIGINIFFYGLLPEYSFLSFEDLFSASGENGNICRFVLAVTLYWLLPMYSFLRFEGLFFGK